jgi:hypothetical protein
MTHYWGAKAIVERAGFKNPNNLPGYILRYHIPTYKRRNPNMPCNMIYYSNEAMMSRWDLERARRFHEQMLGEAETKRIAKEEKARNGLRGPLKRPSHVPNE